MDTRRSVLKKFLLGVTATGLPVGGLALAAAAPRLEPTANEDATKGLTPEQLEQVFASNPAARQWFMRLATAPTAKAPWSLLSPLSAGSDLGLGWTLKEMSDIQMGAAVLTLTHQKGHQALVHICALDGSPVGIAQTRVFDLVIMNGEMGAAPSDEELGRVVLGLAQLIANNETTGTAANKIASKLLPHRERADLFGPESLLS